jgi:hypothetical protein
MDRPSAVKFPVDVGRWDHEIPPDQGERGDVAELRGL